MGQFSHTTPGPPGAEIFQCLGRPAVDPGSACRSEVLIERSLDERVGEAVVPDRGVQLPHQCRRRRGVEDIQHLVLRDPDGPDQQVEVEIPPDDRSHGEDFGGNLAQAEDTPL